MAPLSQPVNIFLAVRTVATVLCDPFPSERECAIPMSNPGAKTVRDPGDRR